MSSLSLNISFLGRLVQFIQLATLDEYMKYKQAKLAVKSVAPLTNIRKPNEDVNFQEQVPQNTKKNNKNNKNNNKNSINDLAIISSVFFSPFLPPYYHRRIFYLTVGRLCSVTEEERRRRFPYRRSR